MGLPKLAGQENKGGNMVALQFAALLLATLAILVIGSLVVAFCMHGFFGAYFWLKYLILGRW